MFERFTDRARRVVVLAQEEARLLEHPYIGTEHLLLGLIKEHDGIAAQALESLDISLASVRRQVERLVGHGEGGVSGHVPFTPRAKKVLELSHREALQLGHSYIGTEHLLLGLIAEGDGVAAQVLRDLGAQLDPVRQAVIRTLGQRDVSPAPLEIEIHLRPLRPDEWEDWRAAAIQAYADEIVRNEDLAEETASARATRQCDELLPDGPATSGQHILVAEDASDAKVGQLWFGPRAGPPDRPVAWLYDITVEEEHQGRGIGRELMRLLEAEVRAHGYGRIELNVFGDNAVARNLYESVGYWEIASQMAKDLEPGDDP